MGSSEAGVHAPWSSLVLWFTRDNLTFLSFDFFFWEMRHLNPDDPQERLRHWSSVTWVSSFDIRQSLENANVKCLAQSDVISK